MRLKLPSPAQRNTRAAKHAAPYSVDKSGQQRFIARTGWRAGYRAALRDVRKALKSGKDCPGCGIPVNR